MRAIKKILISLIVLAVVMSFASCELIFGGNVNVPDSGADSGQGNGGSGLTEPGDSGECKHDWTAENCKELAVCTKCGEKGTGYGSHKYTSVLVSATCEAKGYSLYTCSVCGESYKDGYTDLAEHVESDWIFEMYNGELTGTKYKECKVCGEELETASVDAHAHEFVSVAAKAPTCTEDGYDAHEYCSICEYSTATAISAIGHDWGEWEYNGDSTHTATCKNDLSHTKTDPCSGGTGGSLVCSACVSDYDVLLSKGNTAYGYYALGNYDKGQQMQELYLLLAKTCSDFVLSNEDITKDENGYCVIDTYDFSELSLNSEEARSVWKVFYNDTPLYYWLSSVSLVSDKELFLVIDEDYASAAYRRECDSAIAVIINECDAFVGDAPTDLERAMAVSAYIVKNMEYAYDESGNPEDSAWAHNIIGLAMYDYGVCESYAKAFMCLSLLNDVDCIIGTGYGKTEHHAWNYVCIDGTWYGADITWSDNLEDEAVYDVFGIADSVFHVDHTLHPTDSFGIDFSYEIPEISDSSLELCELYKDGTRLGLYKSIEAALADMTDSNGCYEIRLGGFYSMYNEAPIHTVDVSSLPTVKEIKFVGKNYPAEPGYIDKNTVLSFSESAFTVSGNVVFENLDVKCERIVLSNAEITLEGDTVYFDAALAANDKNSTVTVLTDDASYFAGVAEIYKLLAGEHKVVFSDKAVVEYTDAESIFASSLDDLDIRNYI